jgi:uncharacterized protein affecting Mg2+/Co2+ transport
LLFCQQNFKANKLFFLDCSPEGDGEVYVAVHSREFGPFHEMRLSSGAIAAGAREARRNAMSDEQDGGSTLQSVSALSKDCPQQLMHTVSSSPSSSADSGTRAGAGLDQNARADDEQEGKFFLRGDGMVRWLEALADRMESGAFTYSPLIPDAGPATNGINLFPAQGQSVTVGLARGIEVTSSAIFITEPFYGWTYSIRIRMLQPGDPDYESDGTEEKRGFKTCQLKSRHWVITDAHGHEEHVRGEAVVGKQPVFHEGGWLDLGEAGDGAIHEGIFVYQSCTQELPGGYGTMGGELAIVPGTIDNPEGDIFSLPVPAFPLAQPDFIF